MEHNRDEEIEHAMMTLEWIRRRSPKFDENLRTYLFTEGPITEVEEKMKAGETEGGSDESPPARKPSANAPSTSGGSLGIGGLGIVKGK